jgi:NAD-dependent deacetylase
MKTDEKVIEYLRKKFKCSKKVVAFLGVEMLVESGGYNLDSNDEHYRVEETYGYSPEDILTNSFFNSKPEKFYNFYKNEILGMRIHSNGAYEALMKLDSQGKLGTVIIQNYHGLPDGVNFKNVIEINGSMYRNKCPRCQMNYDVNYILKSKGIPICDDCKTAIRPDIRLLGERADARKMTEVAVACEDADIVLFLGTSIFNERLEFHVSTDVRQLKILFTCDDFNENKLVDFVIRDEISTILPLVVS